MEELQSETAVETQPAATANTGTEPVKDKTMATKNRKRKQVCVASYILSSLRGCSSYAPCTYTSVCIMHDI